MGWIPGVASYPGTTLALTAVGTTRGGIVMGSSKRFFRLVLMATLMGIFAVPPQVMRGQDAGDAKRKVRTQVAPAYPEVAKRMNVHGKVRLEVTVAADGTVKSVHAVG